MEPAFSLVVSWRRSTSAAGGQINAQIPVDLVPGQEYQVLVVANKHLHHTRRHPHRSVTPGIAATC